MNIMARNAATPKNLMRLVFQQQHIHELIAWQVSSLEEHRSSAHGLQIMSCLQSRVSVKM
jgi:hypothetical protein